MMQFAFSQPNEHLRLINLIASCGVKGKTLSAFAKYPRSLFVPKEYYSEAYSDRALPIGFQQTNTQPTLTAATLQSLNLKGREKALEVGTGSGYQTAILSCLVKRVFSIEIISQLADLAQKNLISLKIKNVVLVKGDGTLGYKKEAPFDVIIINAAFDKIPRRLQIDLKEGGFLVMPIGTTNFQELNIYKKIEGELIQIRTISKVKFVPLVGKYGLKKS